MSDIFEDVREAISRDPHRWHRACGIDTERLSRGQGATCPLGCGNVGDDRLHGVPSFGTDGAVRCRVEGCVYDAFDALIAAGKASDRFDAARQLADLYGVSVPEKKAKKEKPSDYYIPTPIPYNQALAAIWFHVKGITEEAFLASGGSLVRYKNDTLIGIPAYAPDSDFTEPVRWILYNRLGLPVKTRNGDEKNICIGKDGPGKKVPKGLIGLAGLRSLDEAEIVYKVEGPTDLLRLWDAIPPEDRNRCAIVTNANGCSENPSPETLDLLQGKAIIVVGDADKPGQKGALKWAQALASTPSIVSRNVWMLTLPYPVEETHGKDVRDFFAEGNTFEDFQRLDKEVVQPKTKRERQKKDPNADDSPPITIPAGQADPVSGRMVLDTNVTLPTAEAFIRMQYTEEDVRTLFYHNEIFYTWQGNAYRPIEPERLRGEMLRFLDNAVIQHVCKQEIITEQFPAKKSNVDAALDALKGVAFLPSNTPVPCWLGNDPPPVADPSMILFGKTRNLDIATMRTFEPSPKWFNYNALDFDYEINPDRSVSRCPCWDRFMTQLFGHDGESMEALMMFIGLLLTPITKFQKALFIVGPKRSGKGTIARIIRKLVGFLNCCSPTTDGLSSPFGLQTLIGKTVAIVSDARFSGPNLSILTERILNVTGEDELSIERKYHTASTMRLPTRFLFLSNEVPRLADASGALASRFIMLKLTESFYGKEDLELENKLLEELPGILDQAITMLKALLEQGHFTQPESARAEVELLEDLASPIGRFIRERCKTGPGLWAASDDLWVAWKEWCDEEGIHAVGAKATFFRNLNAAASGIINRQSRDSAGGRFRKYEGITLNG